MVKQPEFRISPHQKYFTIGILIFISIVAVIGIKEGAHSIIFILGSEKTTARITKINGSNDRCGGGKFLYDCTKFYAELEFQNLKKENKSGTLYIGSVENYNASISQAPNRVGNDMTILYNEKYPNEVQKDSYPVIILLIFVPIFLFFASFTLIPRFFS